MINLSDFQEFKYKILKASGMPKEDLVRELVRDYNQYQDMLYSFVPFGSYFAKKRYLNEEEIIKKYNEKLE